MKDFKLKIILSVLLTAITVAAADTVINTDKTKIGRKVSSGDKVLEFDNNSVNNPKFETTPGQNNLKVKTNKLQVGTGTAADQVIQFNTGAGTPPAIQWNNTSSKLEFTNDGTNFKGIGSGAGGGAGINLIENSGFEDGTLGFANTGGTVAVVTAGSNLLFGTKSVTFDASAASQSFEVSAITVPEILKSQPCVARIYFKGGDANLVFEALDGSSNVLATTILYSATTVDPKALSFSCPSSGSVKWRIRSTADAALVALDNVTLGQADNISQTAQRNVGEIFAYGSASCPAGSISADGAAVSRSIYASLFNKISTTYGVGDGSTTFNLPDARGIFLKGSGSQTIGSITYSGTLGTKQNDSMQGHWHRLSGGSNNAGSGAPYTFGPSTAGAQGAGSATSNNQYPNETTYMDNAIHSPVTDGTNGTPRTGTETKPANLAVNYCIQHEGGGLQSYRPDQVAWRVDANIGGAVASMGTASVASYTGIENASLDLVNNTGAGVISAQIPCSSTNSPTGTTCSVGNESVGVSFNVPVAGDVLACASFTSYASVAATSSLSQIFQLVETANNAQTILQEGKSRTNNYIGLAQTMTFGNRVCGTFSFASAGQKTLRLMYEQLVSGTVVSTLPADRSASEGQRDIHFEVYPLNNYVPAPLLIGSVISSSIGIEKIERASADAVCSTGTCVLADNTPGIANITFVSAGTYSINFTAGTYSVAPTCMVTPGSSQAGSATIQSRSTSAVTFATRNAAGTAANNNFYVSCSGLR